MEIEGNLYQGWLVIAVPSVCGWTFKCHDPKGKTCTYEKTYQTPTAAIKAAREFGDLDITKSLLSQIFEEWVQVSKVEPEEH